MEPEDSLLLVEFVEPTLCALNVFFTH